MHCSFRLAIAVLCLFLLAHPARGAEVVINAVGDIMLAGPWEGTIAQRGYDFPFSAVANELAAGDITIANLEAPIAKSGTEFTEKKFRFRGSPAIAPALKRARINTVTLANNHIMDFGPQALEETLRHLDREGIAHFGAGSTLAEARRPVIMTSNGKRVALLGYSLTQPLEFFAGTERPGTAPGYEKIYAADIAAVRSQADFVIVSFHWGSEGKRDVQEYQRNAARKAIDAGADVIIGHHPHVLRGVERYKRGVIFYSLGNFAFASRSRTADFSALVRLRLDETRREAEVIPLDVLYRRVGFRPNPLKGPAGGQVIERLNALSQPLGTRIEHKNGRYILEF